MVIISGVPIFLIFTVYFKPGTSDFARAYFLRCLEGALKSVSFLDISYKMDISL